MKATKHTVTITVEVLSLDAVFAMLDRVNNAMNNEVTSGELRMADGDNVAWETDSTAVEF